MADAGIFAKSQTNMKACCICSTLFWQKAIFLDKAISGLLDWVSEIE